MKIDLHNHTKLCNHASGEMSEYVETAIKASIDIFGFSCHAPMDVDRAYRMDETQVDFYLQEIANLKEKYGDKIELLSAFEVDFIANKEHLIRQKILNANVDYLIGSVHFLDDWGFDNPAYIGEYAKRDIEKTWRQYLDSIALMAQSGHFHIVGHFDLLKIFNNKPPKSVLDSIKNALDSIKDNDLVLEINTAGLRKQINEIYPSSDILELAFKKEIPITFSSDAHDIAHIGFGREIAYKIAHEIGYKKAAFFRKKERFFSEF